MPEFRLTARYNQPLADGDRIDKGTTITVHLPPGHLPFDSVESKNRVKHMLKVNGYDITGHEYSMLSQGFFDIKKL